MTKTRGDERVVPMSQGVVMQLVYRVVEDECAGRQAQSGRTRHGGGWQTTVSSVPVAAWRALKGTGRSADRRRALGKRLP